MITEVNKNSIRQAAEIHAISWRDSHRDSFSPAFVEEHTTERQLFYLLGEQERGKQLYMKVADKPVGIVTVWNNLIENLYILPSEQNKGHGTELLKFAISCCDGSPKIWVRCNNPRAYTLYRRHGFRETGKTKILCDDLYQLEMELKTG